MNKTISLLKVTYTRYCRTDVCTNELTMSIQVLQLKKRKEIPLKYSVNRKNRIDFQQGNQFYFKTF